MFSITVDSGLLIHQVLIYLHDVTTFCWPEVNCNMCLARAQAKILLSRLIIHKNTPVFSGKFYFFLEEAYIGPSFRPLLLGEEGIPLPRVHPR